MKLTDQPTDSLGDIAAKIVKDEIAHSTLEDRMAREILSLRTIVARQARSISNAAWRIGEHCKTLPASTERKELAHLAQAIEETSPIEEKSEAPHTEFFYGHGRRVIVDQVDGKFVERPMTAVEVAAIAPSRIMAVDIHRYACYAGCCYIWIWEKVAAAFAGFVSPEAHDARVTELLEANNREVERRREAEAECARHVLQARKLHDIVVRLAGENCCLGSRALQDDGELHLAIHEALEGRCAQAWIDEQLAVERAEIERRLGNAPPFSPTHRHYKGGLYEFLCFGFLEGDMSQVVIYRNDVGNVFVRPHKEWTDQVDGRPRFEKIEGPI